MRDALERDLEVNPRVVDAAHGREIHFEARLEPGANTGVADLDARLPPIGERAREIAPAARVNGVGLVDELRLHDQTSKEVAGREGVAAPPAMTGVGNVPLITSNAP